jgi:hypothetical protein
LRKNANATVNEPYKTPKPSPFASPSSGSAEFGKIVAPPLINGFAAHEYADCAANEYVRFERTRSGLFGFQQCPKEI